jgi:FkbM family methyltransferase
MGKKCKGLNTNWQRIKKLPMYFLREGSAATDDPHFVRLPSPSTSIEDKQLLFFPEKQVGKWFFESGMAEKPLIHWVYETFITPDKNFVDIGAHVGTYTWICGKKATHTYAFECGPRTFCYLAANIALHGLEERVSPYPFALGNTEGTMNYIVRSTDGGGNGVKHLCDSDTALRTIKIQMKTLDSFHITNIGFIKIDVEGFEKEVLMGAQETLKANHYPPILFESWGDWKNREGVNATQIRTELFAYIESLGYKITPIRNTVDMYLATHS